MATPMEASVFRSMMTSMTYGTPESTALPEGGLYLVRVGDPLPCGSARLGELHEVKPAPLVLRLDAGLGGNGHTDAAFPLNRRHPGRFHLFPLDQRPVPGLDFVIHLEIVFRRLADQPQIPVVQHHAHEGDLVHDRDRQLLHAELEAVIPHHLDHRLVRAGDLGPDRRRQVPSQRARAAAVQVMPRPGDPLQLPGPDLVQPDAGHEHGLLVEELVDLLEHPLGLDGNIVVVALAFQFGPQLGNLQVRGCRLDPAPLDLLQQGRQRQLGVRADA